jgi:hypothetical protein
MKAPDVHVVFLHGRNQHGAGHGAAQWRGVEVGHACGGDVEGATLQRGNAFVGQLRAAVDQTRFLGAIPQRLARDFLVVGFIGLTEVGGVGVGDRTLLFHPEQGGAGVESAGEGNADFLFQGQVLKNGGHVVLG